MGPAQETKGGHLGRSKPFELTSECDKKNVNSFWDKQKHLVNKKVQKRFSRVDRKTALTV